MSIMLLVCRAGLRREERANIHLNVCFDKTWNGWEEEHTSTSHAEIREASLWDNKRSFHKHQWTEGTFKQAHQNTHQRDIYPPLLTITKVSDSWFCWICTVHVKDIEEKKALSSKASEIEFRERMELFPNISAICREMKKHCLLTEHIPILLA